MNHSNNSSSSESARLISDLRAWNFSTTKQHGALRLQIALTTVVLVIFFSVSMHTLYDAKESTSTELAVPSKELAETAELWKRLWTSDPRAREVFVKARAAFPKAGEAFDMMPWPEMHRRGAKLNVVMHWRRGRARRLGGTRDVSLDAISPEAVLGLDAVLPANPLETSPSANQANQVQTTLCFFDVYESLQFFAYGGLSVYYTAISEDPVGLSGSITSVFSNVAWIASYLAAAASDCLIGQPMNFRANCASNSIWFIGNFAQLAADALSASQVCKPQKKQIVNETASLQAKAKLEAAKNNLNMLWQMVDDAPPQHNRSRYQRRLRVTHPPITADREASITSCFFDTQAAISFFAQFGLGIQRNIGNCDELESEMEKQNCAWSLIYGIDNLGWAMEYLLQIVSDCPSLPNENVLCAEDISDLVFTGTSFAPAGGWMVSGCTHLDGYG